MEKTNSNPHDVYSPIKLNKRSMIAAIEVVNEKYVKSVITINDTHDITLEELRDSYKGAINNIFVNASDKFSRSVYIQVSWGSVSVSTSSSLDEKLQSSRQAIRDVLSPLVYEKKFSFESYAKKLIYIGLALISPIAIIEKSVFYFFIILLLAFGLLFFEKIIGLFSPDENYLFQDEIPESEHGFIKRNVEKIGVSIIILTIGLFFKWAYDVFGRV